METNNKSLSETLIGIDQISDKLLQRSINIGQFVNGYTIESPNVDGLLQSIQARDELVNELQKKHRQLNAIVRRMGDMKNDDNNRDLIELKDRITQRFQKILEYDQKNQEKITEFCDIIANELTSMKNGMKLSKAYNFIPRRKALFVDMYTRE